MNRWEKYRLGEVGTIVGGATPSTAVAEYYGGDVPWLTPKDLSNFHDRYIDRGERNITQEGLNSCSAQLLPAGSVLFSSRAPIGYVAIAKNPVATNQGFKSIVPDRSKADNLFLYYLLRYKKDNIEALGSGTTFKEVSGATMKNIEITLPPLATQQHIAGVLGALDDKIELNRRINANLEEQARALFDQMFLSSNDWENIALGEVTMEVRERVNDRRVKVFTPVNTGKLMLSEEYFTKQVYSQDISKYIVVEPYSFAYNPARINIGSIGMNTSEYIGCVSPVYVVFRTQEDYQFFFDLYIRTKSFREEVKARAMGGVRQTLNYKDFSLIQVKYPPRYVVKSFNRVYSKYLGCIDRNNEENQYLSALRDTLLPKLMAGEIAIE